MLRTALGPAIAAYLEDPTIVEVMLNPDGRLWIDRLSGGLEDTGCRVTPAAAAPCFAIRRPAVAVFTLSDYVNAGIMTGDLAELLRVAVCERKNILVAGGTSTGK